MSEEPKKDDNIAASSETPVESSVSTEKPRQVPVPRPPTEEETDLFPEDRFSQIRKVLSEMAPEEKLKFIQGLMQPREDSDDPTAQEPASLGPSSDSGGVGARPESDVISAKAFEKGMKFGHAPEILTSDEAPGISENDKARIILRHGNTPESVMSNMIMLQSYGNIVEAENDLLYDNNEIDQMQYLRNKAAEAFCKLTAGSAIDTMSSVEGQRFEGLKVNISSGKQAHETIQAEANAKREGRLSRLKRFVQGEE